MISHEKEGRISRTEQIKKARFNIEITNFACQELKAEIVSADLNNISAQTLTRLACTYPYYEMIRLAELKKISILTRGKVSDSDNNDLNFFRELVEETKRGNYEGLKDFYKEEGNRRFRYSEAEFINEYIFASDMLHLERILPDQGLIFFPPVEPSRNKELIERARAKRTSV